MNWDAIGAVGEILGATAVLVTLIYLAAQVREAREAVRRALSQSRSDGLRDLMAQGRDPRLMAAGLKVTRALGEAPYSFVSFLMERVGITEEEAALLWSMQHSWWSYRSAIIPYADELPETDRNTFELGIRGTYGLPGMGKLFYEMMIKPTAHPDAVRYIERLLATPLRSASPAEQRTQAAAALLGLGPSPPT